MGGVCCSHSTDDETEAQKGKDLSQGDFTCKDRAETLNILCWTSKSVLSTLCPAQYPVQRAPTFLGVTTFKVLLIPSCPPSPNWVPSGRHKPTKLLCSKPCPSCPPSARVSPQSLPEFSLASNLVSATWQLFGQVALLL